MLTFQSRFGRAEWLQPYTDKTVEALAQRGVKNLAVVTPGFSADCLETLEEIAVENARYFPGQRRREFRRDSVPQRQRGGNGGDLPMSCCASCKVGSESGNAPNLAGELMFMHESSADRGRICSARCWPPFRRCRRTASGP